jgi:hypothetical protein
LAYVSLPAHTSPATVEALLTEIGQELAAFASREGFALAGMFSDIRGRSESGMYRLIGAIRRSHISTVVIPGPSHLRHSGCLTNADVRTAARHLRARILIVTSESRQPPRNTHPGMALPPEVPMVHEPDLRLRRVPTTAQRASDHARKTLRGLLVPADESRPAQVIVLRDTAAAFSQVLDGSLLDDTVTGWHTGRRFSFSLQEQLARRADNPRAAALAARLGLHDREVQAHLRGDVLVTGLRPDSDDDCDVPAPVLASAERLGLLSPGATALARDRQATPISSPP